MLRASQVKKLCVILCVSNWKIGKELKKQADGLNEIHSFIRIVSGNLPISYEKRTEITGDRVADRTVRSADAAPLLYETNIQQIKNELQEKVKERVDKNQKEYILREEMKVIREELGEDNTISDIKQFEEALEKLGSR